jgi:hypothetical protein
VKQDGTFVKEGKGMKEIILKKLYAGASKESLFDFISWLDKECIKDSEVTSLPYQILARSVVALGNKIINEEGEIPTVRKTINSAEQFALEPTETNWDKLFEDASQSFPFGPGEGCYSIKELEIEGPCEAGTGCISGAGTLAGSGLDEAEVMQCIATELIPWITEIL